MFHQVTYLNLWHFGFIKGNLTEYLLQLNNTSVYTQSNSKKMTVYYDVSMLYIKGVDMKQTYWFYWLLYWWPIPLVRKEILTSPIATSICSSTQQLQSL